MQYTKHVTFFYVNVNHSSILLLGSIALDTIETSHGKQEHLLGGFTHMLPSIIEVFETKDCWDRWK